MTSCAADAPSSAAETVLVRTSSVTDAPLTTSLSAVDEPLTTVFFAEEASATTILSVTDVHSATALSPAEVPSATASTTTSPPLRRPWRLASSPKTRPRPWPCPPRRRPRQRPRRPQTRPRPRPCLPRRCPRSRSCPLRTRVTGVKRAHSTYCPLPTVPATLLESTGSVGQGNPQTRRLGPLSNKKRHIGQGCCWVPLRSLARQPRRLPVAVHYFGLTARQSSGLKTENKRTAAAHTTAGGSLGKKRPYRTRKSSSAGGPPLKKQPSRMRTSSSAAAEPGSSAISGQQCRVRCAAPTSALGHGELKCVGRVQKVPEGRRPASSAGCAGGSLGRTTYELG